MYFSKNKKIRKKVLTFALGGVIITKLSARADANEFDKINELLIERTAKKFERTSKNKFKKVLDKRKVL